MKKKFKCMGVLVLFLAAVFMSSCATTVDVQLNHFQSSEVEGHMKARLEGGMMRQSSVVLTEDYTYSAPETQLPGIERDVALLLGGALGFLDRFEAGLRLPAELYLKFQLLGSPKTTSAPGDFSASIFGSMGGYSENSTGHSIFRSDGRTIEVNKTTYDAGISLGYRISSAALVYVSPFMNATTYDGTYSILSNPVQESKFSGSIQSRGGSLGLEFSTGVFRLMLEGSGARVRSAQSQSTLWGVGAVAGVGI